MPGPHPGLLPLLLPLALAWAAGAAPSLRVAPVTELPPADRVLFFEGALVSCKGQVFPRGGNRPVDADPLFKYRGCGYDAGSCVSSKTTSGPRCLDPVERARKWAHGRGRSSQDRELWATYVPGGPVETIVVLTQPNAGEYYHFVIDSLSRLLRLQEEYPALVQSEQTFFHTGITSEMAQAWARLVGVKTSVGRGNRLLEGCWWGETVIWPPSNPCSYNGGARARALQAMSTAVKRTLESAGPDPVAARRDSVSRSPRPTALLIRRTRKGTRMITNHDEVLRVLTEELPDWEVEVLSDAELPPVPAVCGQFRRAALILGPHGAGFANLVCARGGTPIIEFQKKVHAADFELLAGKLGMPYQGIPTEMDHLGPGAMRPVSLQALREAVRTALEP